MSVDWIEKGPFKESAKRILIISYWRSGSSFLGALIQNTPGVFYTYEPLHCLGSFERMETAVHLERSIDLLRPLLRCKFPDYYFNYTIDATFGDPSFFISSNSQARNFCKDKPVYCKRPDLYSDLCGQFPIHLMKFVRMPLNLTRQLIEEFSDSDFKIIYLTRDPRGIMSSRIDKYFCIHPSCTDPFQLCKQMREDLKSFQALRNKYPNMFYTLRFEDFTENVEREATKLFKFLGKQILIQPVAFTLQNLNCLDVKFTTPVKEFIASHTNSSNEKQKADPFSLVRNSKNVSWAWRNILNQTAIASISDTCADVLQALNYTK